MKFKDFYEDEESIKMMNAINKNSDIEYKKNLRINRKETKKQNIKDILCITGSILLFALVIAWVIILNSKLNQKDMKNCLKNNTQDYCVQNVVWGVK